MVSWSRRVVFGPGRSHVVCVVGLLAALLLCSAESVPATSQRPPQTLGRFEPSPIEVAERMLQLAGVTRNDVVFDLGSGNGRIVILAATRHGARGVGVEIDPQLVALSRQHARHSQVEHLVTFVNADALTVDVSAATVVTLFLTRQANLLLRPKLLSQLPRGARVVSHWHDMGDWAPERVERIRSRRGRTHPVYLWRIWK